MNQQMWRDLELKKISKQELVNTRFAKLFDHFGIEVDGQYMAGRYQEHLKHQGQVYPGVVDLLDHFKNQGFRLFAAKNGITEIQNGRLEASPIKPYFEKVFISEQSGSQKPDKAFYDWIGQQIEDYSLEETLMIGDSLTADIAGGNNAGIDTAWYNPTLKENKTNAKPTYLFSTFEELIEIVER